MRDLDHRRSAPEIHHKDDGDDKCRCGGNRCAVAWRCSFHSFRHRVRPIGSKAECMPCTCDDFCPWTAYACTVGCVLFVGSAVVCDWQISRIVKTSVQYARVTVKGKHSTDRRDHCRLRLHLQRSRPARAGTPCSLTRPAARPHQAATACNGAGPTPGHHDDHTRAQWRAPAGHRERWRGPTRRRAVSAARGATRRNAPASPSAPPSSALGAESSSTSPAVPVVLVGVPAGDSAGTQTSLPWPH